MLQQHEHACPIMHEPAAPSPETAVPIGHSSTGPLCLDLDRLMAGRLLIQESSGAGKSLTLRRIIEEAFDFTTTIIVDPEGDFGKVPSPELARMLGRTKAAMFSRANLLGLVHGYIRPFSEDETKALDIAYPTGISIADLAVALERKPMSLSKYATNHGYRFGRRPRRTPPLTLAEILAVDDASAGLPDEPGNLTA